MKNLDSEEKYVPIHMFCSFLCDYNSIPGEKLSLWGGEFCFSRLYVYVHMASSSNWGEIGMDDLNDIQKIKRMKHRMNSQMEGMKGLSVYVPREDNMAYLRRYPMGYCMLCGHSHEICPLGSWWVINRPSR